MDYMLQAPNITWVDLGPHSSVLRRTLEVRHIVRRLDTWHRHLDALLLRGPSPLLPAMARAARPVPVVLLLVGESYVAAVPHLSQPRWRKWAIWLWALWNQRGQLQVARRALTFVNSHKLYNELRTIVPDLRETRTTTISAADCVEREDTCRERPVHVLYAGRLERAKGMLRLVAALARLTEQGEDVVLDVVGWAAPGDSILGEMRQLAAASGVAERVLYHGFKPLGSELFEYYRKADIYVIASALEGFPRTIWEALAHSLPVVATRVGSIPLYLEDGVTARLVDPDDGAQLAQGITDVMHNLCLRRRLIQEGMALAWQNTLERRTPELVSQIEGWLANRSSVAR